MTGRGEVDKREGRVGASFPSRASGVGRGGGGEAGPWRQHGGEALGSGPSMRLSRYRCPHLDHRAYFASCRP